jgi:hypothetical protein
VPAAAPITAVTPPASWWVPVATGVFALLATVSSVVAGGTWPRRIASSLIVLSTTVHEGAHALTACLTGGGVWYVRVHTPDSGLAHTWHYGRLSAIVVSAAGYAAPPLAGLGAASLLARGHAPMVLAVTVAAMLLLLLVTRDVITLAAVVAIGGVAATALYWGPMWGQQVVAYGEAWLLLLSEAAGLWAILDPRLRPNRYAEERGHDDADALAGETGIPGLVWIAGWAALIGWAVWTAAPLLWP